MEQQPTTLILCYMLDFMRIMELGGPLTCPGQSALSMADEGDGFDLRLRGKLNEKKRKIIRSQFCLLQVGCHGFNGKKVLKKKGNVHCFVEQNCGIWRGCTLFFWGDTCFCCL